MKNIINYSIITVSTAILFVTTIVVTDSYTPFSMVAWANNFTAPVSPILPGSVKNGGVSVQATSVSTSSGGSCDCRAWCRNSTGSNGSTGVSTSNSNGETGNSSASDGNSTIAKILPKECQTGTFSVNTKGGSRRVLLKAPAVTNGEIKAIMLFHGNGDNAENFCATSSLCDFFLDKGYVVIVPNGKDRNIRFEKSGQIVPSSWDAYNDTASFNDDLELFDKANDQVRKLCSYDKLVALGHSQGGYFGTLLMMVRSKDISAMAITSSGESMPGSKFSPEVKVPFIMVVGTADYSFNNARAFYARLVRSGYVADFKAVQGLRHGPFPRGYISELYGFLNSF